MLDWRQVVVEAKGNTAALRDELAAGDVSGVYRDSLVLHDDVLFFMVREGRERFLVIVGEGEVVSKFEGASTTIGETKVCIAPLNGANAEALRSVFPWAKPQAFGPSGVSIGLGDRLGLASPGHIDAVRGTNARPVLAQQSMRELDLTKRSYTEVLDAATWAVFQEGFTDGFGADGDHLKRAEDIRMALDIGFSMITLDCSEHINDGAAYLTEDEVMAEYAKLPQELSSTFEELYKDRVYEVNGTQVAMDPAHYYRMVLTYYKALDFIEEIYQTIISQAERAIDFEVSIDEVDTPTKPQDHFFVANELNRRGIKVSGVAPRFCGAFEKGIDYIGDITQFEAEFAVHARIAQHFGYKLSIHSGSDKFSVFPIIGKYAKSFHVKTAGTNWLEAVRVIAQENPVLFRELYKAALDSLDAARKYYKVSLDLNKIPDLDQLADVELPQLLDQNDARQLLHITYGFILQNPALRERFYDTLIKCEDRYREFLCRHIGRHLETLGLK